MNLPRGTQACPQLLRRTASQAGPCRGYNHRYGVAPCGVRNLQVDVCDKVEVSSSAPSLDVSYYSTFSYTLLDGSSEVVNFDSTPAKDPTGEVQV